MAGKRERPHVVHFIPHYPGQDGVSSYGTEIVRAMNQLEEGRASIISLRRDKRSLPESVPVEHFPQKSRNPFRLPEGLLKELDIRQNNERLYILHGAYNPKCAAFAKALQKRNLPYVYFPHDPYVKALTSHHAWRKWAFWHLYEKPALLAADAVQLLCDDHIHALQEKGCRVKTFTVPNGCDPNALSLLPLGSRTPGTKDDFIIQYLGRMDRNHKGLDLLLEAFAIFLRQPGREKVYLVLTGNDWSDRPFLENQARSLRIDDQVRFTGRRAEPSVVIQAEADLCVLPSRFDGFGLTLVEAMLAARPVLVSTQAGIAEHVKVSGAGFLSEPDSTELAKSLEAAWNAKSMLEDMGNLAQKYVLENLTWERAAQRSLKYYQSVFDLHE